MPTGTVKWFSDEKGFGEGAGSVGFRIGIQGPLREYRNSLVSSQGIQLLPERP